MNDDVSTHPTPEVAARLRELARTIPVCTSLGFEILELTDGHCSMRAAKPERFDGLHGVYHGGMLTTVADSVAWFAITSRLGPDTHLTTSDLHMRFLAGCWTDVFAEATVVKFGRTLCPVDVELYDADQRPVAVAQVTYFRLDKPPSEPQEG